MKRSTKKTILSSITVLLLAVTLFSMFPISASAASSNNSQYYPRYTGRSSSIVDALNSIGVDSSFSHRKTIAKYNGLNNYSGKASENNQLLSLLKAGKLKNPSYSSASNNSSNGSNTTTSNSSSKYYPRYYGQSGSIVTALNSVGVNSSYSYRAKIAAANNIANYRGSSSQNTQMVSLLKKGLLIRAEYVASNNTVVHNHILNKVSNTDNLILKYCTCGYFECKKSGLVGAYSGAVTIPLPNSGNLVDLGALGEAVNSLGVMLGAAGATVAGVISSPPFLIAATVCGIVILISVTYKGRALEITKVERLSEAKRLDELESNKFYCAAIINNNGFQSVLIIKSLAMNMDEAIMYAEKVALFRDAIKVEIKNQSVALTNLYTYHRYEAKELCTRLSIKNKSFKYGGDSCPNCSWGFDKKYKGENKLYYKHYHLYYWNAKGGKYDKVEKLHIFFGTPYVIKNPATA